MSTETDTVQSTSQSTPYLPNMGQIQTGWGEAARLYNRGAQVPDAYKMLEQRYNGSDPQRQAYDDMLWQTNRDLADIAGGNAGMYSMSPELKRFASGEMLSPDSNPWLKGMYEDAAGAVRGQVASQFAGAGRYGSGANQEILGKNLGSLANTMYGGAYQQGLGQMLSASMLGDQLTGQNTARRMQAMAMQPSLMGAQDNDLYRLGQVQQAQIDAPWTNLQRYMGIVNPGTNFGSTQTNSQPSYSNPVGQGLGLLGGGLSAANMAFGQNGLFPGAAQSGWNSFSNMFSGGGGFDPFAMDYSAAIQPMADYGYF